MRILNSFSRSNKRPQFVFAIATLLPLSPGEGVSRLFNSDDPLLIASRVETVELTQNCEEILKQSLQWSWGGKKLAESWEPWASDDRGAVRECDEFPCDVKLNAAETEEMKKQTEDLRPKTFESLVSARWSAYEKTQKRPEYEFKGDPVDPWKYFQEKGLIIPEAVLKLKPQAEYRRYDFVPGKLRPVRQVLDHRVWTDQSKTKVFHFVRDAYNAHYFDGWGEWIGVDCPDLKKQKLILSQVLFLEFDLLKKNDLFSVFSRSKMRMTVEKYAHEYQDAQRKSWIR